MSVTRVTVLMPVYNGSKYLGDAIESILNQTFTQFEFLIIDDGSTDNSVEIIRAYPDARIRLIRNSQNIGIAATLNKGIDLAATEYIARMDCDDISAPDRLQKQVRFMDLHPEVGICGTWIKTVEAKRHAIIRYPTENDAIRCGLIFYSAMAHPSVIIRKSLMIKDSLYYDASFKGAEDYDLWVRASTCCRLANLPEVLLDYRIHSNQSSSNSDVRQRDEANIVRARQIASLGIAISSFQAEFHGAIADRKLSHDHIYFKNAEIWLLNLIAGNNASGKYPKYAFDEAVSEGWFRLCLSAAGAGWWPIRMYCRSALKKKGISSWMGHFVLFVKWGAAIPQHLR